MKPRVPMMMLDLITNTHTQKKKDHLHPSVLIMDNLGYEDERDECKKIQKLLFMGVVE